MKNIGLVRVDSRLLHGQVVTRWIGKVGAKEVIIIDDELAKDDFMIEVFEMAAPSGVKLIVKPTDEAKEFLGNRELSRSIILFKSIPDLLKGLTFDLPFTDIQIGGIGGGAGRVVVFKSITLTKEEYEQLLDLENDGKHIYLQTVPEDKQTSLADISNKF
ncbi:PTS sugar transporter [Tetragenococcus halophilus subsp. flandriensis]|uniref:PTS sugar transporter subunit IIB n=1 Tax=Tetragenococcus halophilus TaxID=51669 RepID=UPI0023E99438|nr:PTS sugar transporter subunit IIB [Tetragenococcus halophilus]GMA09322.1 PTS sugar transporter [Tetragenococcus halophilus subsp. flandriensis]